MFAGISKHGFIAGAIITLGGCSGHVYTVVNPTLEGANTKVEGIITYPPVGVIEKYVYTTLTNKEGNIIGSSTDSEHKCMEKLFVKYAVRADYNNPQIVHYEPGIFEKNIFNIKLSDGMIGEMHAESDTTQAAGALIATAETVAGAVKGPSKISTKEPVQACNSGEILVEIYKAPKLESYPQNR